MRKFISEDNNTLSFYYKLYDDEHNDISWILFVCEDKTIKNIENDCDIIEIIDDYDTHKV